MGRVEVEQPLFQHFGVIFLYCVQFRTGYKRYLRTMHGKHYIVLGVDPDCGTYFPKLHCEHSPRPIT